MPADYTDKNTLKSWFKRGLKPLEAQFHAWMDSFWHKSEEIPTSSIKGLEEVLNNKAEFRALQNHAGDATIHITVREQVKLDNLANNPNETYATKQDISNLEENPDLIIIPVDFGKTAIERNTEAKAYLDKFIQDGSIYEKPIFANFKWKNNYAESASSVREYSIIVPDNTLKWDASKSAVAVFNYPIDILDIDTPDTPAKFKVTVMIGANKYCSISCSSYVPDKDMTVFLYDDGDGKIHISDTDVDIDKYSFNNWRDLYNYLLAGETPAIYLKTNNTDNYIPASYRLIRDEALSEKGPKTIYVGYIEIMYTKVVDGTSQLWVERRNFSSGSGGFKGPNSRYDVPEKGLVEKMSLQSDATAKIITMTVNEDGKTFTLDETELLNYLRAYYDVEDLNNYDRGNSLPGVEAYLKYAPFGIEYNEDGSISEETVWRYLKVVYKGEEYANIKFSAYEYNIGLSGMEVTEYYCVISGMLPERGGISWEVSLASIKTVSLLGNDKVNTELANKVEKESGKELMPCPSPELTDKHYLNAKGEWTKVDSQTVILKASVDPEDSSKLILEQNGVDEYLARISETIPENVPVVLNIGIMSYILSSMEVSQVSIIMNFLEFISGQVKTIYRILFALDGSRIIAQIVRTNYYTKEAIDRRLDRYIPLAGGTVTGNVAFETTGGVSFNDGDHNSQAVILYDDATKDFLISGDINQGRVKITSVGNIVREYKRNDLFEEAVVWDSYNDGVGSGLDADLLDGKQGSEYVLKTEVPKIVIKPIGGGDCVSYIGIENADVKRHTITVQYAHFPTSLPANGGNADTVDGKHAFDFVLKTEYDSKIAGLEDLVSKLQSEVQTLKDAL